MFRFICIPGSAERIILLRKKNRQGNSFVWSDGELKERSAAEPVLVGYLRVNPVNSGYFKTVELNHSPLSSSEKIIVAKDSVDNKPIADSVTAKNVGKVVVDTPVTTVPSIVVVKKEFRPISHVSVKKPQSKHSISDLIDSIPAITKVFFLVKLQLIITAFLVVSIFVFTGIRNRRASLRSQLNSHIRPLLVNAILADNLRPQHISTTFPLPIKLKKHFDRKTIRQSQIS